MVLFGLLRGIKYIKIFPHFGKGDENK